MLDILTLGDEFLREKTERIKDFGPEIPVLADAMVEAMQGERGIGLAGPQVGVLKRIFVVDLPEEKSARVFINPEILETSQELASYEEGCLSIPGMYANVIRPVYITVQAQDVEGKPFTIKADGLLARVIQHENDHLQGVLFIDRLTEEKREKILKEYEKRGKRKK
ncbi:MAG: peptide deformylase [Spirochaetales bacterium]|nr:peptide deformylase [Spirochaetales bacterium]